MPRSLALALLPLLWVAPLAQLDGLRLRVEPSPIVWISGGDAVVGASTTDVGYAIDLCRAALPLRLAEACDARQSEAEGPQRRVHLSSYGIDRTEVTQAAWSRCVVHGRCRPSRIPDDHPDLAGPRLPVAAVSYDEARSYCDFVGGRLPTQEEWEHAARGSARHRFPWGRHFGRGLANHGRAVLGPDASDGFELAAPVGSFPHGASPYGLLDAAGNVWEWTSSPPRAGLLDPSSAPEGFRVVRGGSWAHPPVALRVTSQLIVAVGDHRADLGLRCAYAGPPAAR